MKRNLSVLLFGVIFLIVGFCYLGSMLFDFNFTIFFDGWWTMFIIVPAFISVLSNGPRAFNVGAMLIGIFLLLVQLELLPDQYFGEILFGSIILYIGVILITRYIRGPRPANTYYVPNSGGAAPQQPNNAHHQATGSATSYKNIDPQDFPNYTAVLNGINAKCVSSNFKGARVSAVLGGVDLDLRDVIITEDIVIYVTAITGGVDILAPQNVRIALNKTDILGGTDCKAYSQPSDAGVPLVTFVTTAILGGIDIK